MTDYASDRDRDALTGQQPDLTTEWAEIQRALEQPIRTPHAALVGYYRLAFAIINESSPF